MLFRSDLIGVQSVFTDSHGHARLDFPPSHAGDVRLRVAGAHDEKSVAERLLREVVALYTCGPAGGGGIRTALRPRMKSVPCFIPREEVKEAISWQD